MAFLSLTFLSACGDSLSSGGVTASSSNTQQQTMAPIGMPPGAENKPLKPGASGTTYTPDGLPALQPAKGINADMLFAEKINDSDMRFDRLETAVSDMRREFDAVKPAIVRLVAVEGDMQELLTQLESLVQNPPAASNVAVDQQPLPLSNPEPESSPPASATSVQPAPVPAPEAPKPAVSAPVSVTPPASATKVPAGSASVQNFRIGEHGNMTRLVLDMSGAAKYSRDLDNTEHLLVIEIPTAVWSTKSTETLNNAPLIQSWSAQPVEGGGSRLIINLKKNVKIIKENTLSDPARILFDLQADA